MPKGLRNLSTMFGTFSLYYEPQEIMTVHLNYVPSVLEPARTMHGLEMHLMLSCNEFWIYIFICVHFLKQFAI